MTDAARAAGLDNSEAFITATTRCSRVLEICASAESRAVSAMEACSPSIAETGAGCATIRPWAAA